MKENQSLEFKERIMNTLLNHLILEGENRSYDELPSKGMINSGRIL